MNRDIAVEAFVKRIIARAYTNVITNTMESLEQGPIERDPTPERLKIHTWYKNIDADSKATVQQIISETAFSVLFGCLVVLDNSTTSYALENEISDFGLFVQRYSDNESYAHRQITESIQINDRMDLHDALKVHMNK